MGSMDSFIFEITFPFLAVGVRFFFWPEGARKRSKEMPVRSGTFSNDIVCDDDRKRTLEATVEFAHLEGEVDSPADCQIAGRTLPERSSDTTCASTLTGVGFSSPVHSPPVAGNSTNRLSSSSAVGEFRSSVPTSRIPPDILFLGEP